MHDHTILYLSVLAQAALGVAILLFAVLIVWETLAVTSQMWKRSYTFRPFIIGVFAATIALFLLNEGKGTFRDTFSMTFDEERKRARGDLR